MQKDGIIFYKSHYELIKDLSNEQLGKLYRAIFEYQSGNEIEIDDDLKFAFRFIYNQVKLDTDKYNEKCETNKENGKKGGRPKKANGLEEKPKKPNGYFENRSKPKKPDNNNNNNNNKKEIYKEKYFDDEKINDIFLEFLDLRKKLKVVNTDRAVKMLINKLNKYDDEIKYKMIEKSIVNSWKDVYEIKEEQKETNYKVLEGGAIQLC